MLAYLALATAMILTGINVALGKIIVTEMPPASFAMLRFVLASACLVPLAMTEKGARASLLALTKRQWFEIFLLSLFGVVGFTTLMLIGIQYTSAINAGIIASSLPAIIALLSWLVLREYVSPRKALSVALAVVGIACINLATPETSAGSSHVWSQTLLGNGLILAAVTSEAIFAILTRRYANMIPPWTLTMIVHLLAIPITLPVLMRQDGGWVIPQANASFWLLAVYYIITASVVSFYLWCVGIKSVSASSSALFTALVPTSTLLVAVFALGEKLIMLQIVGLIAVLASLFIGLKASATSHSTT
ncbi:DMT family transporter [Cohaesibacter celericrescens]|uniref:DMT family transporter n=1 Tax=Cohaesibacter celericrescens TaxID=2067669 RepID=UPI0035687DBF